jgi:hypothetical protein
MLLRNASNQVSGYMPPRVRRWRHVCPYETRKAGSEAITAVVTKRSVFWDMTPLAFTLVSCLTYFSTVQIEATCSSEKSVDFQRTTRRYIPQGRTLNKPCRHIPTAITDTFTQNSMATETETGGI